MFTFDSEIHYEFVEDNTEDFVLTQTHDGEETDQIRMKKPVALQLAWEILNNYTVDE